MCPLQHRQSRRLRSWAAPAESTAARYPPAVARISYIDPDAIADPELAADMEDSRRYGTPRPETQAIRFHVPDVARAFMLPWKTLFREGLVEHPLKELCRNYVSQTIGCDY